MKQQLRKRGALLLVGHLLDPCDESIDPAAADVSKTKPRLLRSARRPLCLRHRLAAEKPTSRPRCSS